MKFLFGDKVKVVDGFYKGVLDLLPIVILC